MVLRRAQHGPALDLRLAKTALASEIATLKIKRDELKAATERLGPMRQALERLGGYAEGAMRAERMALAGQ